MTNKILSLISGAVFIAVALSGCSSATAKFVEDCQSLVKADLKAPATAQFSEVEVKQEGSKTYLISGSVDSQNGFGALLRNSFECEFDGENMNLNYVSE